MRLNLLCLLPLTLFIPLCANGEGTNWPSSAGPTHDWSVKTSENIPIHWSVRKNENVKWTLSLPEGGQSGIAIWEDRLFLTINPPLDTPPYAELRAKGEAAKTEYEARLKKALEIVESENRADFVVAREAFQKAERAWNAKVKEGNGRVTRALRKSPEWRSFNKAKADYEHFIHQKDSELPELKKTADELLAKTPSPAKSADVLLLCVEAHTGKILWEKPVKGKLPSDYHYGFSDSTTPCPITDGPHVWVINASGGMSCFTIDGNPVWERTWNPTGGRPFNKQYDSIIHENLILNVEPPQPGDTTRTPDWNYIHAFDKATGKHVWTSRDALTHYNTPSLGVHSDGRAAVLIARGGPHGVPERPVGLSLVDVATGDSIWQWAAPGENKVTGWGSLNTMHWDRKNTFWMTPEEMISIETVTGKTLSAHPINKYDEFSFDIKSGEYQQTKDKNARNIDWEWYTTFRVGSKVFYLLRHSPFLACHDLDSGKTTHLELPREFNDAGDYIWKTPQSNDGLNARGQRHARDARMLGDGFQRIFLGTPTKINQYLFFTNALGIVYVIDTSRDTFGPDSLVAVNDLGKRGETWTVNSLSYCNGYIFHRTLKELICIGE